MDRVKGETERIERLGGRTFVYRKLYGDAELNYTLVKQGIGLHNLPYTEELLEVANQRLDQAIQQLAKRSKGVAEEKAAQKTASQKTSAK
jgi:hypothetical protein